MLAHVYSCAVIGLEGVTIDVEVDYGQGGVGRIAIVGLPDEAVKESKERVYSAIKNSELAFPRNALTVNLAPASVRKEGPAFDLPIAVGILITYNQVPQATVEESMFVGELSLDG
ncbi:MAG: magnesium chelatase, partial [Chloroflexi bacterium]|nr:magnesium chelatase [Chloroflexota bacterium]